MGRILVVDDERSMREFLGICLGRAGHEVAAATSPADAFARLDAAAGTELVITDLKMVGPTDGLGVLEEVKRRDPTAQVVVVTAFGTTDTAITAMKRGAYDYLTKPFKIDELLVVVERALERRALLVANAALRERIEQRYRLRDLIGMSPAMATVFELVRKVAPARSNVLITGESGTGKELVARAIHFESPRAAHPFVPVNCAAIPETLIESELFGHVKGAFTGAAAAKIGLFEAAEGGTLFLDEIAELPPAMQVKILRALQERRVKPVGGVEERAVDVRVVAATNRDLEAEVKSGGFRQDLYYRLNVIQIHIPPLRQRREDIPLLVDHFLRDHRSPPPALSPEALGALCDYDFPGNVRELENLVERAVALEPGPELGRGAFPTLKTSLPGATDAARISIPQGGVDLDRVLADYEREIILQALRLSGGVRKEAARLLHITFRSFRYRLEKLGIDPGLDEPSSTEEQ